MQALKYIFFLTIMFTAYSCGQYAGNNDYAGGGIGGTGITGVSVGKISRINSGDQISVSVNEVDFTIDEASIIINGKPATEDDLREGMIVTINGEFDAGGLTAKAIKIEFDNEIEGPVYSIDTTTNTLVVLGKTIIVDGSTIFENTTGLAALSVENIVEVSGFVDVNGIIHATYIEFKSQLFNPGDTEIELKGFISNLHTDAGTFDLNGIHVVYTSETRLEPEEMILTDGLYVEVKSTTGLDINGVLSADKIENKETTNDYTEGEKVEIEGIITELASAYDFKVNNQSVHLTDTSYFKKGTLQDIKLNIKLEVKGTISNGVLIAKEISIESEDSKETEHDSIENNETVNDDNEFSGDDSVVIDSTVNDNNGNDNNDDDNDGEE